MEVHFSYLEAHSFLQQLKGQHLCYGLKSRDMDLYDFGFGECFDVLCCDGRVQKIAAYVIHATCEFKIIHQKGKNYTYLFDADTPVEEFKERIMPIIGLTVKRVELSADNELWLDFGDYWFRIITFDDDEESWRFFLANKTTPHVVFSASGIVGVF